MYAGFNGIIYFNSQTFINKRIVQTNLDKTLLGKHVYKGATIFSIGAHEAAHLLERALIDLNQTIPDEFFAWQNNSVTKKTVKEAILKAVATKEGKGMSYNELIREIAPEGFLRVGEINAEAIADFYDKRRSVALLSRIIWRLMIRKTNVICIY